MAAYLIVGNSQIKLGVVISNNDGHIKRDVLITVLIVNSLIL